MPRLVSTPQRRRFLAVADADADMPATLPRAALDDAFAAKPQLRGYMLDEPRLLPACDRAVAPTPVPRSNVVRNTRRAASSCAGPSSGG